GARGPPRATRPADGVRGADAAWRTLSLLSCRSPSADPNGEVTHPMSSDTNKPRSWEVTDGPQRAPARAMLRAVGFSEEDFGKSQVGVASSWNEVTPCNY